MGKLFCHKDSCFENAEEHDAYVNKKEAIWSTIRTFSGFAILGSLAIPMANFGFGLIQMFPLAYMVLLQVGSGLMFYVSFLKVQEYGGAERLGSKLSKAKKRLDKDDQIYKGLF